MTFGALNRVLYSEHPLSEVPLYSCLLTGVYDVVFCFSDLSVGVIVGIILACVSIPQILVGILVLLVVSVLWYSSKLACKNIEM